MHAIQGSCFENCPEWVGRRPRGRTNGQSVGRRGGGGGRTNRSVGFWPASGRFRRDPQKPEVTFEKPAKFLTPVFLGGTRLFALFAVRTPIWTFSVCEPKMCKIEGFLMTFFL